MTTPPKGAPPTEEAITDICGTMKKLVNSWYENDFCSKLLDELLEYEEDFLMSAQKEKKFTYQLLEAAGLSLLAIIGLQQSSRIEDKLPGNTEILEYAKAAARRLSKAGDIFEIVAREKAMPVVFSLLFYATFLLTTRLESISEAITRLGRA